MDNIRQSSTIGRITSANPAGANEPDHLVRQEEAAALLSVTARCMENWRHRGEGPKFVRIFGRCIRYRRSDLDDWIERRIRTSTSDQGADAA